MISNAISFDFFSDSCGTSLGGTLLMLYSGARTCAKIEELFPAPCRGDGDGSRWVWDGFG